MNKTTTSRLSWGIITLTLAITATSNGSSQFKMLEGGHMSLSPKGVQEPALLSEEPNGFPFRIEGSRFVRKSDDKPVFLNIIGYQPLEPGQERCDPGREVDCEIRERRVKDDLRRWRPYQGGSDLVVVRLYPGPTEEEANRISKCFYDGIRELGFWIIRDIYVTDRYWDPNAKQDANDQIDRVIAEVNDANAFNLIFAWEIGNEFGVHNGDVAGLEEFVCQMSSYIKERVREVGGANVSDCVTWAAGTFHDPLWTWDELPVRPECLDYIGYNTYGYEPKRMRDHQTGPTTGTPYQGYLAALKECYPNTPLVIAETGLSDSNSPENTGDHARLHPWYPVYRKGGLTSEQGSEGLADRYWDARLLQGANDPNIVIAGFAIFEWNDEWHKGESDPNEDDGLPEEHFGLGRFVERPNDSGYQLRYKLQQETIRDLYTLKLDNDANIIESLTAEANSLAVDANTWVHAVISDAAAKPVRLRWEASKGYIIGEPNGEGGLNRLGEPNHVKFYAGKAALGPALITLVAIDANRNVDTALITININTLLEPNIEILTFGVGVSLTDPTVKASGCVYDVNLDEYKPVVYVKTDKYYAMPYHDQGSPHNKGMKSIWVNKKGYWWTKITHSKNSPGELHCWLVDRDWPPPDIIELWEPLPDRIAEANTVDMDPNDYSDTDNDLLLDRWEREHFRNINKYDRYDDPDEDIGNNLEEFLRGLDPNDANDDDQDGLWDNWEYHFFGDVNFFDANDDPDGDRLRNWQEQDPNIGTHPARASQDEDRDGLADTWEMRWFGNLVQDANDNFDDDCFNNLDEYELSLDPTSRMADLDLNCEINLVDYSLFALHWGESDCNELNNWCGWVDLDENGEINLADLYLLTENWLRRLY